LIEQQFSKKAQITKFRKQFMADMPRYSFKLTKIRHGTWFSSRQCQMFALRQSRPFMNPLLKKVKWGKKVRTRFSHSFKLGPRGFFGSALQFRIEGKRIMWWSTNQVDSASG